MQVVDETVVRHWRELSAQLRSLRKQEMAIRQQITNTFMQPTETGTKHEVIGGYELTATVSESFALDSDVLMSLLLTEHEKECVQWKPSIIKRKYVKLPASSLLRTAVTIKHGAPTLKVSSAEVL